MRKAKDSKHTKDAVKARVDTQHHPAVDRLHDAMATATPDTAAGRMGAGVSAFTVMAQQMVVEGAPASAFLDAIDALSKERKSVLSWADDGFVDA